MIGSRPVSAPRTQDVHVLRTETLPAPRVLKNELPGSEDVYRLVVQARAAVRDVIAGRDPRLLAIVGPCSIHDADAALDYARRLQAVSVRLAGQLLVVMRV